MQASFRFVTFESQPCTIREKEIKLLKCIVNNKLPVQQSTHCGVGDTVRIARGPLRGWEGRVESKKNKSRIVFCDWRDWAGGLRGSGGWGCGGGEEMMKIIQEIFFYHQ